MKEISCQCLQAYSGTPDAVFSEALYKWTFSWRSK